jgi:hypothetical protein
MGFSITRGGLSVISLALLLAAHASPGRAQVNVRSSPPAEPMDIGQPDAGDAECELIKAIASLEGPAPTMTLEGSFCADPAVYIGSSGGTFEPLAIAGSGPDFIDVDMTGHTDPGTFVVIVECPDGSCALDVTLGAVGPEGPAGATGPVGPAGPTGPQGAPGAPGYGGVQAGAVQVMPAPGYSDIVTTEVVPFSPSYVMEPVFFMTGTSPPVGSPSILGVTNTHFTVEYTQKGAFYPAIDPGGEGPSSLASISGNPALAYSPFSGPLRYVRATDASGTSWGTPVTLVAGPTAAARLVEVAGNPAISYQDAINADLWYVRAADTLGTEWDAPIAVHVGAAQVGEHSSLAVIGGNPAVSYYWSGTVQDLKYKRAADALGTAWGAFVSVDTAGDVGRYASLAEVDGRPAISYYDNTNGDLKYVRATDASGTSWGAPIAVDNSGEVGWYTSLAVIAGNPAISYCGVTNGDVKYVRATDASGTSWGAPIGVAGGCGTSTSLVVIAGNPAIGWGCGYARATDALGTTWELVSDVCAKGNPSIVEISGEPFIVNNATVPVKNTTPGSITWVAVGQ